MQREPSCSTLFDVECAEALAQLGGIASHSSLLALTSRRKVRTAVAAGTVLRISKGRYALPVTETAKLLASRLDAHLSHESAALHYGWEILAGPAEPRLVIPSDRVLPSGARARIRLHDARPGELLGWATSPVTTVLMCARDLAPRDALAIADSALRHRSLSSEELVHAAEGWPEHVRWIAAHATAKASNPFESALRCLVLECGQEMVPQYEVVTAGIAFHPDLADPIAGILVEGDSWSWHADKEAHERDCRRYTLLACDGWIVLRFTYDDVMHRPEYVKGCLRAAYALARGQVPGDAPGDTPAARRVGRRAA